MTRSELEHIIRAAGDISGEDEIVVIGSQAILGQFPDAPESLRASIEADLFPMNAPHLAEDIDAMIGSLSQFQVEWGVYAHGVSPNRATLPRGWESRLVVVENANTNGRRGLCLEVHDLVVSKYVAGRPKDYGFNAEVVRLGFVDESTLLARVDATEIAPERAAIIRARIRREFEST